MMTNLFSVFDPSSSIFNLSLNWMSTFLGILLIPCSYWLMPSRYNMFWTTIMKTLHKEFKTLLGPSMHPGSTLIFISLFSMILFNNFLGLFPYIFTSTSHLVLTLSLALPLWASFMIYGWTNHTQHMFAHLVPQGTPAVLMPFMVCIETISNIIRPGTLAVRLSANMIAGHLLLTLLGNTGLSMSLIMINILLITQLALLTLESAVAIIQSYVFAVLSTLYSYLMSTHSNHPFHLVDYSPWPLMGSIGAMTTVSGLIKWFHKFDSSLFILGNIIMILTVYQWWRDISREGTFQGLHTQPVLTGLRWGMILFITSEVFFFLSFFWAFFHSSLSPSIELGSLWPPMGIKPFNPFQIPLLNTIILLTSGITVTWAHHSLMEGNHTQTFHGLFFTVLLGIYFSILQAYEYMEAPFTIADSVYGSTFYMATGFHGLHVLIGTTFLLVCLIRHSNNHFSKNHHFGFEAAAWYWHFVDIVWLFLYISIYWWGS